MRSAEDYLNHVKALIALNAQVLHWVVVREEAQGDRGLLRYRLSLRDGSLLEMFEFFQVQEGRVCVTKYRFHWQQADGRLRKRWDNAKHHAELSTYPHHVHDGAETTVQPHSPVDAETILAMVDVEMGVEKARR